MQDGMGTSTGSEGAGAGAGGTMSELKTAGREAAGTAKEAVRGLKEQAGERATESVNERKHALADSLESVVHALRAAEKALRDDNQDGLAAYSSNLASYVERSTGYVRNNDMPGLMEDLQRVGREHTGVFMGGTFAAGAALGRFLRASAPEPEPGAYDGSAPGMTAGGSTGASGHRGDGAAQMSGARRTTPSAVIGEVDAGTREGMS